MTTITIDTHKVVKRLVSRGYSQDQAEGFVETIQEINFSDLATKADLRELELRMTVKLGGMVIALGAFLTAIKYLG